MNNISNIITFNGTSFNDIQTFKTVSEFAFIKVIIIIIARAGFVLIQSGSIPTEQFYDLLLQNIVEFSISSAAYGLLGSILSFGKKSFKGIIAYGTYSTLSMDYVVYGYCVVIFGSAIITTCLSSRLHFFAYTALAFVYAGITQPILLHWIYSPNGWMKQANILNNFATLHDFGGGFTLNLTSGLISLIGLSFLGRRLLKLHDIDEYSIGSESPTVLTLGYALVIAGYVTNSVLVTPMDTSGNFLVLNVILSVAGGGIASIMGEIFVRKLTFNFWLITRLLQGSLIGLTFTASVIDLLYPPIAFGAALLGGSIISFSSKLLFKLVVQDYCNVITIFFLPGVWSPIIQVILTAIGFLNKIPGHIFVNFVWHTWCSLWVLSLNGSVYGILFFLLWCSGYLRNECEKYCHARSLNLLRYTKQCPLHHLIDIAEDDDVLEPGVSGKTPNELIHKHQQDINLRHFRVKYPETKKFSKQPVPHGTASSSSHRDHGGTRNIYTFQNLIKAVSSSHPFSSGDGVNLSKIFKFENTVKDKKKTKLNGKAKKKSHHKLSRSPRFTDFRRRKKIKTVLKHESLTFFKEPENEDVPDDFDAKYNDGFVTIKLPNRKQYVTSD